MKPSFKDERGQKQRSWEIIYSDFSGMQKKAIELLSKEVGKYILRKKGVYALYVLPCHKEGKPISKNAIIIGTYEQSALIRQLVNENDIPENGYYTKVTANPDDENYSFIVITAKEQNNLYYAALAFLQDYITEFAPLRGGGLRTPEVLFDYPLKEKVYAQAPKIKTRSIFTWGHPINDYRAFIDDMARQKLNQLIIWNDYLPMNAKDIIDYAHSYNIELIWGYEWGWLSEGCSNVRDISPESLKIIKDRAIEQFEKNYKDLNADGIYFQSFTECENEYINGVLIAKAVTDLVNDISGYLLGKYPDLKIQFGLHAMSVKNQLDEISRIDKRVEIIWEDCGEFPYAYTPKVENQDAFEETLKFTEEIINLRDGAPMGLVFKGFMTLDWTVAAAEALEYGPLQKGPFILGDNHRDLRLHDKERRKSIWQHFYGEWTQYGTYAQRVARIAAKLTDGNINLCMAGMFDGGIWVPEAICSEIFWNPEEDFKKIVCKSFSRDDVVIF